VNEWLDEYKSLEQTYDRFTKSLGELLTTILSGKRIPHVLQMRTKKLDSLIRKMGSPDKAYERLDQITDLTGLRVLTYLLSDAERVREIIEEEFEVDWSNTVDKRKELQVNQLGYNSINYVVSLSDVRAGLTEYRDFAKLKAEIQVGTLLSHVWSEIEHPYYKGELTVPPDLRRRLFLVKGLLEVADLQLHEFKQSEIQTRLEIATRLSNRISTGISIASLTEYLENSKEAERLLQQATKAGFAVVSSESQASIVSDLADACLVTQVTTIEKLQEFITASKGWVDEFLCSLNDHVRKTQTVPWSVGCVHLVLFLLIAAFPDRLGDDFFVQHNWSLKTVRMIRNLCTKNKS